MILTNLIFSSISGYSSHKFGRKSILMYISASYTLSWLLIAYAPTVGFIYAGRLLSGFSAGMTTVVVPAYVVEISTVKIRGLLSAGFQVAFSVGVVVMTSFGIILRWSWLAILGAVNVVAAACLLYFMPESPPWLIRNGRSEEGMKGIRFLKGKNHDVATEFKEIVEQQMEESKSGLSFREILNPNLYKPLLIAFGLMFSVSFCGFPPIMSYTVRIFEDAGSILDPNVSSTILMLIQMVSTIVSSLLMDRAGRKILFVISGSIMTFTLTVLGIYTYYSEKYDLLHWKWIPLVTLMIYISAFSLGFGPIPYVVIPELVPTHTRSVAMAVGCASASFLGFVSIKTFDALQGAFGLYGLYWLYGIITLCASLSYWIFVPETKGRSVHEINKTFTKTTGN